jgi:TatA/E family protein of Tat protein translocase
VIGDILQPTHLLFILVVALLVLGPKRLPEVGRSLGKGLRDFRGALSGLEDDTRDLHSTMRVEDQPIVSDSVPVTPATTVPPADPAAPAGATVAPEATAAVPAEDTIATAVMPTPKASPGADRADAHAVEASVVEDAEAPTTAIAAVREPNEAAAPAEQQPKH